MRSNLIRLNLFSLDEIFPFVGNSRDRKERIELKSGLGNEKFQVKINTPRLQHLKDHLICERCKSQATHFGLELHQYSNIANPHLNLYNENEIQFNAQKTESGFITLCDECVKEHQREENQKR